MKNNWLVFLVAMAMQVGIAKADCERAEIQWLQSKGYSPREAMEWCKASPNAQPAGSSLQPAKPNLPPLQVIPPLNTTGFSNTVQPPAAKPGESASRFETISQVVNGQAANGGAASGNGVTQAIPAGCAQTGTKKQGGGGLLLAKDVEKAGQLDPLSNFSTKNTANSSLVTGHIATGFAPAFIKNADCPAQWFNFIAIDISASVPAKSATLKDYGKQALLTLDGGVLNIYGSFPGLDHPLLHTADGDKLNPRAAATDRYYFVKREDYQNQLLVYTRAGLGGRGVKTALEGNGFAGLATAYFGFGVDGPLLTSRDLKAKDPGAGWATLETYAAANVANKTTFNKLFGTPATRSTMYSWASTLNINLPGKFYLSLGYFRGSGDYGRSAIGGVTMLTFGYNGGPDVKKTTPTNP